MLILLTLIGVNLAKYLNIGIITTNEVVTVTIYTPVACLITYVILWVCRDHHFVGFKNKTAYFEIIFL